MRGGSSEGYKCETCNRIYGPVRPEDRCPYCELERLRSVLREVQWQMSSGGQGRSSYRICIGCGVVSHGSLSTPPHKDDCVIEVALKPK